MKQKKNSKKLAIIAVALLLSNVGCNSQKITGNIAAIQEAHNEFIWIPSQNEESYKLKISDTTVMEIFLIFERTFEDSVKVFVDLKEVFSKKIKTNKTLSVVDEQIRINYSSNPKSLIEIWLIEKNRKLTFHPKLGYVICYLNRVNQIWSIEFSNYERVYY